MEQNNFEKLASIDVNEHTEKKNGLTYLSWAWAVDKIGREHPDFNYKIKKTESGLPYFMEKGIGAMVFTEVTIDGITREMWLPVMDSANMPMKEESYGYKVKEYKNKQWTGNYIDRTCEAIDMFAVNKTIMRCLVKNIAMFGLGLYIYAGEDLPQEEVKPITTAQIQELRDLQVDEPNLLRFYKVGTIEDLTEAQGEQAIKIRKGGMKK